jgi:mannose-6-phosphate isomerase-like protein (cupin superfamily)
MLVPTLTRSLRTSTLKGLSSTIPKTTTVQFSSTRMASKIKPSSSPPKHEMAYFPQMLGALPASSHEFRRVLWTGLYSQVVLMTVPVGGDIGDEVHTVDQALTFTSGKGKATIAGKDQDVRAGDLMVVPAGTQHQFVNTGDTPLVSFYHISSHKPRPAMRVGFSDLLG